MINWANFEAERENAAAGPDECPVCGCVDCECELEMDDDRESCPFCAVRGCQGQCRKENQ